MTSAEAPLIAPPLIPVRARGAWQALAAALADAGPVPCRTSDPEAWWPHARERNSPSTRAAVAACRRCPAEPECLSYALAADERFGIWGATLPDERRALRFSSRRV